MKAMLLQKSECSFDMLQMFTPSPTVDENIIYENHYTFSQQWV
jgi:hypothetical protein